MDIQGEDEEYEKNEGEEDMDLGDGERIVGFSTSIGG